MRLRFRSIVFASSLCLATAGCGGSGNAPAPATSTPAATSDAGTDACAVVTQEDATALFGQPAKRQDGTGLKVPIMVGECLWTWDGETANQLLQFRIWSTEKAYSDPTDGGAERLTLGDKGYMRAHPLAGVDIQWVQGGRTVSLAYSTVGSAIPSPLTKVDAMKALAKKASGKL